MSVQVLDSRRTASRPGYGAPACRLVRGRAHSSFLGPEGYSLWLVTAALDAGATLEWDPHHGDEAVFVVDGELEVDGRRVGAQGTIIVELDARATVRAVRPSRIAHFGPTSIEPPVGLLGAAHPDGHGVHTLPHDGRGVWAFDAGGVAYSLCYYADSTCPTCRIAFFRNTVHQPLTLSSHLHSEDEIVYLLGGDAQLGPLRLEPGMGIAISKGQRYRLRTHAGFDFLNYRRNAATIQFGAHATPSLETEEATRRRYTLVEAAGL